MSITISGLVVAALSWILQRSGVVIGNDELTQWVAVAGQIVGGLIIYFGRVRQGDITWYGTKKVTP